MEAEVDSNTELREAEGKLTASDLAEDHSHSSGPVPRKWYSTAYCWLVASTAFLAVLALFLGLYVGTSVFETSDDDSVRRAPPPPVVIQVVPSVRSEILFDTLEIEAFQSPEFDAAFRTNFTRAMSNYAGVSTNQVNILGITAGSVKVESTVTFSPAGASPSLGDMGTVRVG